MRKTTSTLVGLTVLVATAGAPRAYRVPRSLEEVRAAREARADSPLAALEVAELATLWDDEEPEQVLAAVAAAAADRRTPPFAAGYARWLQAELLLRLGRVEEARALVDELGFVQSWLVLGPFDNDNEAGFDRVLPPERSLSGRLDLEATFAGKLRQVGFTDYPAPAHPDGRTALGLVLDPSEASCAYLYTVVESPRAQRAALRLGADGAIRLWLNGLEVYSDAGNRRAVPDRAAAGVGLGRGRNRIVVKSCNVSGPWNLYFRLTAPDGGPLPGLRTTADRAVVALAPRSGGVAGFEVPSLSAWFHARAEQPGAPAEARADLARFLARFGGDDPDESRATDEAVAALEAARTVEHLELVARLHSDRNRRVAALEEALELEPRNPGLLLALAGERMAGHHPEDALPLVARAEAVEPGGLHATIARADLLDGAGLTLTAVGLMRRARAARETGRATAVLRGLAARAGLADEEERLAVRYFESHRNATGLRIELARRRAERLELGPAAELLRAGLELDPLSSALRGELASVLEADGDLEGATEQRRGAIAVRPEAAALHGELARFLDRQGRTDEAIAAARRSLELRPENPDLREWLEALGSEERFEGPYLEDAATFLARRGAASGHDVHTLVDLRVRLVHQSGQSSEFRQVAYEASSQEGTRQVGRFQVAYAPDRQRLRVERARVHAVDGTTREALGQSSREVYDAAVRMYYDIRVVEVLFGDLRPGDVVEVRYRLEDVAGANELGDYFGELVPMQAAHPVSRSAYVLLAPAGRDLVFFEPELARFDHRVRELDDRTEHVFEAREVAAVPLEPEMPPLAEVAARVHVSTYSSWEALGRWYWSLVRDQLELDSGQRSRAESLVAGAADDLERVRAVHRHVVGSVRYVALEFGVHRYKPYRVSEVERRGFGDCKDQASLMVAMLRHVGVPAEIALVRTRHLGRIGTSPASLEVFNHAIVYLPSLGIYVDPTAERVAVGDLPEGDQGVMALRVGEGTVVLGETPLLGADRQGRRIAMAVALDRSGSARGTLEMSATGWLAGALRSALDDPAGRVSYLERLLSRFVRGLSVSNVRTTDLTELSSETRVTLDVQVPGLGRPEGEQLTVPVSVAPPIASLVSLPERRHDLVLGAPLGYREELTYGLPPGLAPAALPPPVEVDSELARFGQSFVQTADGLRVSSELEWRAERVRPEAYAELRRFAEQVTAARAARIRLVSR